MYLEPKIDAKKDGTTAQSWKSYAFNIQKQIYHKNSEPPDTAYFSYEFDNKDRVTKQIVNQSGKIHITLYTYY